MNAITSLSARQLRRAAEIKEEIQSLQTELDRVANSPDAAGINVIPRRRGRLRAAIKAGISAATRSRWTQAGARSLILPAQRLKRRFGGTVRAEIADAKSRLAKSRNISIT